MLTINTFNTSKTKDTNKDESKKHKYRYTIDPINEYTSEIKSNDDNNVITIVKCLDSDMLLAD